MLYFKICKLNLCRDTVPLPKQEGGKDDCFQINLTSVFLPPQGLSRRATQCPLLPFSLYTEVLIFGHLTAEGIGTAVCWATSSLAPRLCAHPSHTTTTYSRVEVDRAAPDAITPQ